jgi:hypothetical protein
MASRTRSDDVVAPFSARGVPGDPNVKPDLVAPGVSTVGLRAPGSVIDTLHPTARVGSANFRGSGTSMATAIASGNVAGLLSELPDLDPDDVKSALTQGAYDIPGGRTSAGAGGLDLVGAMAAAEQSSQDRRQWSGKTVAAAYGRLANAWRNGSRSDAAAAWLQLPVGLRGQIAAGRVAACHDVSGGGLLVAIAQMAMAANASGSRLDHENSAGVAHMFFASSPTKPQQETAMPGNAMAHFAEAGEVNKKPLLEERRNAAEHLLWARHQDGRDRARFRRIARGKPPPHE